VRVRRETVEHPFGTLKMRMGATHLLMKRLPKVATEMALHVLAYNVTRVMNLVGIQPLIAAMANVVARLFVRLVGRRSRSKGLRNAVARSPMTNARFRQVHRNLSCRSSDSRSEIQTEIQIEIQCPGLNLKMLVISIEWE
jgi:hypothetical protein